MTTMLSHNTAAGDLERRVFQLETLYEIGRECAHPRSPHEVLRVVLAMVTGAFGAVRGLAFLHDAQGVVLALHARGLSAPDQAGGATSLAARYLGASSAGEADDWLAEAGMEVAVRFGVDETAQGALALGPRLTGQPYGEDDRALLQTIVDNAAVYLRAARLLDTAQATAAELARKVQALAVTNELALGMTSRPTVHRLHSFILERVAAAVGATAAAFLVPQGREGGEWAIAARVPDPLSEQGAILFGAAPALVAEALARQDEPARGLIAGEGGRELAAPIRYGGRLLGALWLQRGDAAPAFDRSDHDLLGLLTAAVAVVLENNRLFERFLTQQQEQFRLRALFEQYLPPSVVERLLAGEITPPHLGTHRRVSLVRVDIRASTELGHQLNLDVNADLTSDFLERMTDVLFQYEGTIDRFDGDAVLGFFGAPEAHEDDPVRAVRTGLEMQRAFASLRAEWRGRYTLPAKLGIGVGITTGDAVVGNVGSAKRLHYTVSGLTANLAARLMAKAPAGTLLMDEATWQAVQAPLALAPRIRERRPHYVHAKGFPDPVPVFRLRLADVPEVPG